MGSAHRSFAVCVHAGYEGAHGSSHGATPECDVRASSGGSLGGTISKDEERLKDAHPHAEQPTHGDEFPLVLFEDGM